MTDTQPQTNCLPKIAELVTTGDLGTAAAALKEGLEAVPGMRQNSELAMLHREVILHKGSILRLDRDSQAGRITNETERVERAQLTAALLDVADEIEDQLQKTGGTLVVPSDRLRPARLSPEASLAGDETDASLQAPDVFLSYARPDRGQIVELAVNLRKAGCTVWFDHYLAAGAKFREVIGARLKASRVVLVLWSEHSVKSDWVLYEADFAHRQKKLLPLRMSQLAVDLVPPPYPAVLNILPYGDSDALMHALKNFGLPRTSAQ